jgi:hypothetical protein
MEVQRLGDVALYEGYGKEPKKEGADLRGCVEIFDH